MSHTNRVVLLIDMDCFYCQVEENLNPNWKGKPLAVVQYNQWRGGGIIAVNYPARDKGVTRHMRGNNAKAQCPDIILAVVPNSRGKADLSKYRDAGKRVADVLQTFTTNLERASVDEAYLDITSLVEKRIEDKNFEISVEKLENTHVVGSLTEDFVENVMRDMFLNESNLRLALGGVIAEEIRAEVFRVTGYRCSAGVAHNKILAKLVCGLHKPNKQTILPHAAVPELYKDLPLKKIKSLGGQFGDSIKNKLGIEFMGQLARYPLKDLSKAFNDKNALWLYNIAKGVDTEPVCSRLVSKSIGCSKKFPGKTCLTTKEDIDHWLRELADELSERLEKDFQENGRKGRQMVVSYQQENGDGSKSHPLSGYEASKIVEMAWRILQRNCMQDDGSYKIFLLGISVGNFQDVSKIKEITSFFKNMADNNNKNKTKANIINQTSLEAKPIIIIDEDDDDDDIYAKTTDEELSPDGDKNVTFFEQIYPDSINQNYETAFLEDDSKSNDSIGNELQETPVLSPPTNSFFRKYFSGNANRDFNTSKHLEPNTSKEDHSDSSTISCNEISKTSSEGETNTCPECGKSISPEDYQSHLDYHFALSIVKNEAHLYKGETSQVPVVVKSKKRKSKESPIKPINNFFKPQEREEEDGHLCTECNKKIREVDWDVHQDFHAAKRLHLEMNVQKCQTSVKEMSTKSQSHSKKCQTNVKEMSTKGQSKAVKKGGGKKELLKGQCNMLGFLKHV